MIKESQRLLPAVPITLPRRITRPVEIAASPPVPKGALLFLSRMVERGLPVLATTRVDYGMVNGVTAGPTRPVLVRAGRGGWSKLTGSVTEVWQSAA